MSVNSKRKLKVFHGLVNYGTQAGLFAAELRAHGIDAISVTYPDKFKRQTDIELLHGGNIVQKILKHSWNWVRRFYWFFRYNTFHFYFGTSLFPNQLDLKFYKLFRKKVVMEYLGWDVQLYQYSIDKYGITNAATYKDISLELQRKNDDLKIRRLKNETKYVNKQFVCAPYLSEFVPNSQVLPLGINLLNYSFIPLKNKNTKLKFLHAPTSRGNKGTDYIIRATNKLLEEGYIFDFDLVENITHKKLKDKYAECDVFIGQILSGWYGTAEIEAMAIGRPTICFYREEYLKYIEYGSKIPLINANPTNIYFVLKDILEQKYDLEEIGKRSRQFVEEIHDIVKVTKKLIQEYKRLYK